MSKSRSQRKNKDASLWMLSFSDMTLALLCFFVLLISMMDPNKKKFDYMRSELMKGDHAKHVSPLEETAVRVDKKIKEEGLQDKLQTELLGDELLIEFADGVLFQSGSAQLSYGADQFVKNVYSIIGELSDDYELEIEGHTDDVPVSSRQFASNWDLSAARAIALLRVFENMGVSKRRLSVAAYAHTRPKQDPKGLTGDPLIKARQMNRRVSIRLK